MQARRQRLELDYSLDLDCDPMTTSACIRCDPAIGRYSRPEIERFQATTYLDQAVSQQGMFNLSIPSIHKVELTRF